MGAPVALSATPPARTYRPSGPHMPMIAPGIEAAVITWSMAASSRCAVAASISYAVFWFAVFVVAVADDGDDVESLPHADTKINSATAIVACRLLITSAPYRGVRLPGTLLARPCVRSRTTGLRAGTAAVTRSVNGSERTLHPRRAQSRQRAFRAGSR